MATANTKRTFTVVIEKDGPWYVGYVQELPGANTQGRTLKELRENLVDSIQGILAIQRENLERDLAGRIARTETITVETTSA